jgi:hypothetical protein
MGDAVDLALSSRLILAAEHKLGLKHGTVSQTSRRYSSRELEKARVIAPAFQKMDDEWSAKRRDIAIAAATLPSDLQKEVHVRLRVLDPAQPLMRRARTVEAGSELEAANFIISLDPASAAIVKFENRKTGREWASSRFPLASFRYETFTRADFARFNSEYNTAKFANNDLASQAWIDTRCRAARGSPACGPAQPKRTSKDIAWWRICTYRRRGRPWLTWLVGRTG